MKDNTNIQYPFALDENEELVAIESIQKGTRKEQTYHCPSCGGIMTPRLGDVYTHCFAHGENQSCGVESYIHATAKRILKNLFNDKTKPFRIGFTQEYYCSNRLKCHEDQTNCYCLPEHVEFDLHDYYTEAFEESGEKLSGDEQRFTPDVVLRNGAPSEKDLFLEVYYKNKSSRQKRNSKFRIIEIRIRSFVDLKRLFETSCFNEGDDICFYNFKKETGVSPERIAQAWMENAEENGHPIEPFLPPCKRSHDFKKKISPFRRFILYKSGKTYDEGCFESDSFKQMHSALAEVLYDKRLINDPLWLLATMNPRFRYCQLCANYIALEDDLNHWCKLGKNGSKRKDSFDNTKGARCIFFDLNERYSNEVFSHIDKNSYKIWVNPESEH